MGIHTRMYKLDEKLAINIPSLVLPPSRLQTIEETVTVPGYEAETITWFPLLTGKIAPDGRMPMVIRRETLEWLGLDSTKDVFVRLKWDIWRRAHVWHQHKRLWIPRAVVKSLEKHGLRPDSYYDVHIRGTTPSKTETRTVTREVIPEVIVRHLGKDYKTDNYAPNRWRWIIPEELYMGETRVKPTELFNKAFDLSIIPEAECYYAPGPGVIETDLIILEREKELSSYLGYAYRNIANRNFSLKEVDAYPFFCELRCSDITAYPRDWYQFKLPDGREQRGTLVDTLENSVINLTNWHPILYGIWYGEQEGKITFSRDKFKPTFQRKLYSGKVLHPRNLSVEKMRKQLDTYEELITAGQEINEKISYADAIEFNWGSCIKYIRIVNKQMGYYIYDNARIEYDMASSEKIECDSSGFVWRKWW